MLLSYWITDYLIVLWINVFMQNCIWVIEFDVDFTFHTEDKRVCSGTMSVMFGITSKQITCVTFVSLIFPHLLHLKVSLMITSQKHGYADKLLKQPLADLWNPTSYEAYRERRFWCPSPLQGWQVNSEYLTELMSQN